MVEMNSKALSVFIILVLIIGSLPSINSLNNNTEYPNENYKDNENFYKNQMKDGALFRNYPVMDEPIIFPDTQVNPYPINDNLPDQFSWKNYNGKDWTTPAKNQGSCGSCWAFGAIALLESMVKIREGIAEINPDFSEQYVLSCLPEAGSCRGGRAWEALRLLQEETPEGNNANGTIFEECFPYQADDDIPCSDKCPNWMDQLVPILNWGYWDSDGTSEGRKAIKSYIFENGPVVTHIRATDWFKLFGALFHNPNFYYPRFRRIYSVNHVVLIVGWKDIPNIPSGGYWICKNSWGTDWGYDGFFNIAYGSLNIDRYRIIWADYDPDSYNWPPVADAGGSYGAYLGEEIIFDASESFGYEGEIINYKWDFGDGINGTGINPAHKYEEIGKYTVTLTVTDVNNIMATDTTYVWIQESNTPPKEPKIDGPSSGPAGVEHSYTIVSEDSEGNDIWYLVDWGDDKVDDWTGPFASGEEAIISHTWQKKGDYTVSTIPKDVFGDEGPEGTLPVYMQRNIISSFSFFKLLLERLLI